LVVVLPLWLTADNDRPLELIPPLGSEVSPTTFPPTFIPATKASPAPSQVSLTIAVCFHLITDSPHGSVL